jgi:hypothetical protein
MLVDAAQQTRREQAVLVTELQRRGEPLEEPAAPASASDQPKPSAAAQERLTAARERFVAARPALRPPDMRPDRPKERNTPSAGHSAPARDSLLSGQPTIVTSRRRQHELLRSWSGWPLT